MVIWQGLEMSLWKWGILVSSEIMEPIELATGLGKLVLAVSLSERKKDHLPHSHCFTAGYVGRNIA